jgi:magnesium-transporting ATPase (P-type)
MSATLRPSVRSLRGGALNRELGNLEVGEEILAREVDKVDVKENALAQYTTWNLWFLWLIVLTVLITLIILAIRPYYILRDPNHPEASEVDLGKALLYSFLISLLIVIVLGLIFWGVAKSQGRCKC